MQVWYEKNCYFRPVSCFIACCQHWAVRCYKHSAIHITILPLLKEFVKTAVFSIHWKTANEQCVWTWPTFSSIIYRVAQKSDTTVFIAHISKKAGNQSAWLLLTKNQYNCRYPYFFTYSFLLCIIIIVIYFLNHANQWWLFKMSATAIKTKCPHLCPPCRFRYIAERSAISLR